MPALAPFTFKGLNEQLLGIWVNWMPQVNQNMIDSPCFLCLLCFWSLSLYRCGVDMWRAEGRGPHLSWLILQPVCAIHVVSMHTGSAHVCTYSEQTKDFLHVEKTPFALRHLPQGSDEMMCLHCKTGLGNIDLCSLCTKCLQHGCSPDGTLIDKVLGFQYLFSSRCNLLCVSSSLLSCFLATYSSLQYLHEFTTHQLPTHNSTQTSNIFRGQ